MNPYVLIGLLTAAAFAIGGSKRKPKPGAVEPIFEPDPGLPGREELPLSDRMLFDENCFDVAVQVMPAEYDFRITERYWQLRAEGFTDPQAIAVEVLAMDSPQCQWPAVPGQSSPMAVEVWEATVAAITAYRQAEIDGTLGQFDPVFGF